MPMVTLASGPDEGVLGWLLMAAAWAVASGPAKVRQMTKRRVELYLKIGWKQRLKSIVNIKIFSLGRYRI